MNQRFLCTIYSILYALLNLRLSYFRPHQTYFRVKLVLSFYKKIYECKKRSHFIEHNMQHKQNILFMSLESMILLGSIERCELQAACDWWLSAERRITNQGQAVRSPGSVVSWESFSLVDEEGGEGSKVKVRLGP